MDIDKAIQAIRELWEFASATIPGTREFDYPSGTSREAVRQDWRKAFSECTEAWERIQDAKVRLTASGFDIPDKWIQADIVGGVEHRKRDGAYWLVFRNDDEQSLKDLAAEMRAALRRLTVKRDTESPDVESPEDIGKSLPEKERREMRAIQMLLENRETPDDDIAKAIGVTKRTLYRYDKFRAFRANINNGAPPPSGEKSSDGSVEAWDEE